MIASVGGQGVVGEVAEVVDEVGCDRFMDIKGSEPP